MASSEVGNIIGESLYPFLATKFAGQVPFPFSSDPTASWNNLPPSISAANPDQLPNAAGANPHLDLPYTLEWNFALEQALGKQQSLSATYTGAAGRRLLQGTFVASTGSPNLGQAYLVDNTATSDYDALQLQFQRRLSHGLQSLVSYTWAHSIDSASAGSAIGVPGNASPGVSNRGPSDFDIRHAASAAVSYQIPVWKKNRVTEAVLGKWFASEHFPGSVRSARDVFNTLFGFTLPTQFNAIVRPDVVPGQPFISTDRNTRAAKRSTRKRSRILPPLPTGCDPAVDFPCALAQQGNLSRNALRGFGAWQWDFAVHREVSHSRAGRVAVSRGNIQHS